MEKNIFIVLITTLLVLFLIYKYENVETIQNKEYIKNNTIVTYPYFNNEKLDNYINDYINKNSDYKTIIDYDYNIENNKLNLTLYMHKEINNKIKETNKKISINLEEYNIKSIKEKYYKTETDTEKNKFIALTFDDGPNHNTEKILNILNKYNIKATFFILGKNIKGNEKIISMLYENGMQIGNHTYNHKLLTRLKQERIEEEINETDEEIEKIIGVYPKIVRPCYGSVNYKIRKIIDRPIITWNIDTEDWKYHNSDRIYKKVISNAKDGSIGLMHDIYTSTYNSLEKIIIDLKKEGYKFVTIDELFEVKNVKKEPGKVYRYIK